MTIESKTYTTKGGVTVQRECTFLEVEEALTSIRENLKVSAGALFSSGYEYPGRYSRWDIGFYNPPLELIAWGRSFEFKAKNEKGQQILVLIKNLLEDLPELESLTHSLQSLIGKLKPMPEFFSEEERSRQPSLFSVIRRIIEKLGSPEDSHLGLYGAFGYDLVFQFDPIEFKHSRDQVLDAKLYLPDQVIVVDRRFEKAYCLNYDFELGDIETKGYKRDAKTCTSKHEKPKTKIKETAKGDYTTKVEKVREGCKRGDYFEVVLSQTFQVPYQGDALDVFATLQERNPSPYEFILQFEDEQLVGASPEMFVRVEGDKVETCPISGTAPRGESPLEDADRIKELLASPKEEAELTMCTDVDRNDKSRVCKPESVKVLGRRMIELYSKVIHTVDHVEGILKPGMDGLDAFLSHMWAVTLSGSPKKAAMQEIENLEESPRGWYGGAIGILSFNGDINTGITIRTVHLKEGVASIRVGATLLYASDPKSEEKETEHKASAFIKAVVDGHKSVDVDEQSIEPKAKGKKVLFVDHQDSFVHTLAGYVRRTGAEVLTLRAGFPESKIDEFKPDLIFLSPGPFTPEHFGLPAFIKKIADKKIPMFGVCLGLQGMVEAYGGKLGVLDTPQHGVYDYIQHDHKSVFKDLPSPLKASRYHSLYAMESELPDCFEVIAKSQDDVIMGIRHKDYPMAAVQFHPESIHSLSGLAGLRLINQAMEELL